MNGGTSSAATLILEMLLQKSSQACQPVNVVWCALALTHYVVVLGKLFFESVHLACAVVENLVTHRHVSFLV